MAYSPNILENTLQHSSTLTMRLTKFLPLSVGTAAAIDIYVNTGENCSGSYSLCTNIPPNLCCGVVVNYSSVAFLGVPTNWNLNIRAHKNGVCNAMLQSRNVVGSTHYCLSQRGAVTGGGYSFVNSKKRDELDALEQCSAPLNKCEGYQRPNEVGFTDGVKYDLTRLDEAAGDEILAIMGTHGSSAEVPATYDIAKITE